MIRRSKNNRRSQAMVEYVVMVAMVAGLAVKVSTTFQSSLEAAFNECANQITVNLTDVLTGRAGPAARNQQGG